MARQSASTSGVTLRLVRHASAGHRDNSNPDDSERRLDDKGHRQARNIAEHLKSSNIAIVVSSPLIRCVQTVEPLADYLDMKVSTEEAFAELTPPDRAWHALESLVSLVADARPAAPTSSGTTGLDVVICSHGDIIPGLLRTAVMRGTRVRGRSGGSKGSVWTLRGWDGVTFETASYASNKEISELQRSDD